MRLRRLMVVGVAGGLVLAGCGVPIDAHPQAISRNRIPYGLLSGPPATPRGPAPGAETASVQVFFVDNGHLRAATRRLRSPLGLPEVLTALLAGPTRPEVAAGLSSALGSRISLQGAAVVAGTAHLELSGTLGQDRLVAVAQLVYTSTEVRGVRAVSLSVDGKPVVVTSANGAAVAGPFTRADFASVGPGG